MSIVKCKAVLYFSILVFSMADNRHTLSVSYYLTIFSYKILYGNIKCK